MKLAQQLAFIITGIASFLIPFALADFHLLKIFNSNEAKGVILACPSKKYGCDCFLGSIDAAAVWSGNTIVKGNLPVSGFSVGSPGRVVGLCGSPILLDVYNLGNGTHAIYVHGGNGTLQGTCKPNYGTATSCGNTTAYEIMLCSTHICN